MRNAIPNKTVKAVHVQGSMLKAAYVASFYSLRMASDNTEISPTYC